MQSPFSGIASMHTVFVTPFHSSNVMSIHFSLSVSALTLLIMVLKHLVKLLHAQCGSPLRVYPQYIESSTGDWYEMHVGTRQWNINCKLA